MDLSDRMSRDYHENEDPYRPFWHPSHESPEYFRRKYVAPKKSKRMFIAVVYHENPLSQNKTLSSFVDSEKEVVVERAVNASRDWSSRNGRKYRVLVGELTEEARVPVAYEVVPL